MKRRDPGILELVRHYNKLCSEMATLVRQRKAPRNAIPPKPIDAKGIWGLDVDDEIWQDVGLDDTFDESAPPLWLKDDNVRDGIKAMLELDRCDEEEPRLFHECRVLRYWLSEEWDAVTSAMDLATEEGTWVSSSLNTIATNTMAQGIWEWHTNYSYDATSYANFALAGSWRCVQSLSRLTGYRHGVRLRRICYRFESKM